MALAIPVINAVAGVVSVVGTLRAQRDQKRAAQAQQEQQELATQRSRRSAIRQQQILAARARSSAAALGAGQGSGASGGLSSLGSQLGTGLGFSTQMSGLSRDITNFAASARANQALAGLAGSVFNMTGGFGQLRSTFNFNRSPAASTQPAPTSAASFNQSAWVPARPTFNPTPPPVNPYAIPNGVG